MTRALLMIAAIVALALTPSIGIGTAQANGGGFHGGGFRGGGLHSGGLHHRTFPGGRRFWGTGFGYGGDIGYTDQDTAAEGPSVFALPNVAPAARVDRPPCRETTSGVVIMRGTSCSHGAQ
jgi:hypothetical protein